MTVSGLVDNFTRQYRRPFNLETVANLTGLSKSQVRPVVLRRVHEGQLREIETGIFVTQRDVRHSTVVDGADWTFRTDAARRVLDLVSSGKFSGLRGIAQEMGVSRQFVWWYMEALATIGAIGYAEGRYHSTGEGNLLELGCKVERGILRRMKKGL